jgi:hypothetical protein
MPSGPSISRLYVVEPFRTAPINESVRATLEEVASRARLGAAGALHGDGCEGDEARDREGSTTRDVSGHETIASRVSRVLDLPALQSAQRAGRQPRPARRGNTRSRSRARRSGRAAAPLERLCPCAAGGPSSPHEQLASKRENRTRRQAQDSGPAGLLGIAPDHQAAARS